MKSAAVRVFLVWLALMLAGVAVVWNSRFTADMSFFLPSSPSAEQRALVEQLQDGSVSRLLMVAVEGGDEKQRAEVSRALRQVLAADPDFLSVQNGEAGGLEGERDRLLAHRYALSPSVAPERFTEEGLRSAVTDTIDLLSSPAGMLLKPYLARDPTGEVLSILGQLNPGAQPQMRAGVWASRDGERAMLLLQTRVLGSDTDGQALAIDKVHTAFEQARASTGHTALTMVLSGPGQFAVQARETIKSEAKRLSLMSSIAIWLVLFWVYRSFKLLALGLIPVLSGTLAGIAMVSLVHGTVFGVTVGFGSALIGEAADLTYAYAHLGTDRAALAKALAEAKADAGGIVIVGQAALRGSDGEAVLAHAMAIAERTGAGLLVLHTAASRVGAMDVGAVTEGGSSRRRSIRPASRSRRSRKGSTAGIMSGSRR